MNSKEDVVNELHKPVRKNFLRRHVIMRGIDETWQADLVDMSAYSKENQGNTFLLTVIDTFSKFAWAVPLKTKNATDVTKAMKYILDQNRQPRNLQVDQGSEFYNKKLKALMKQYKINMYSTFSVMKASICERFNRTLKSKMWKRFSLQGHYNWINILSEIIKNYNATKHRTIMMKPKDVISHATEEHLLNGIYFKKQQQIIKTKRKKSKFKVGDKVRISKYKHIFEKGYTPNWTTEIFTIKLVKPTHPITYKLIDYQGHPIEGGFYSEEIAKVKHSDVYLVEKVLRKLGDKLYVKWLGFDDTHNSWINKTDI